MADRYDLEHCARIHAGQEVNTPYLDQFNPNLVTAEELANKLGFDQANGLKYVKATFPVYVDPLAPDVEPEVEEPVKVTEAKKK
jgi:hypothetical protein